MLHLTEQDPATIGFVVQCLTLGVISNEELRAWAEELLVAGEDCLIYVEGLAEFDGPVNEVTRMIGFVPDRQFTAEQVAALEGLRVLRQTPSDPPDPIRDSARAALERHPDLLQEFRLTFPLIRLEV